MHFVGKFKELEPSHEGALPLASAIGQLSEEKAEMVLRHLKEGIPIFDVMEAVLDPVDGRTSIPGGSSLVSDGEWVWRNDLTYFVQKYRVGLPGEFLAHVANRALGERPTSAAVVARLDEALLAAGWRK